MWYKQVINLDSDTCLLGLFLSLKFTGIDSKTQKAWGRALYCEAVEKTKEVKKVASFPQDKSPTEISAWLLTTGTAALQILWLAEGGQKCYEPVIYRHAQRRQKTEI